MIEIIGMTVEDALAIEEGGGERIELVSALTEGGLTPSYGLIEAVVKAVNLPVNIMIRHHSKSFLYTKYDIEIMKRDIEMVKYLGANGVVFGMLNEKRIIHKAQLAELLEYCDGLDVTFHKAIDETNVVDSMKVLATYKGVTNVLTAGGRGRISEQTDEIKRMKDESGHLNLLLGGGLTLDNLQNIKEVTGCTDFHLGTAVRKGKNPFGEIDVKALQKVVEMINR